MGGLFSLGSLLFGGPLSALQAAASASLSARAFLAASFSLKVVSSRLETISFVKQYDNA